MLIPAQVNKIEREMTAIKNEIYRAEKHNRTERAERLKVTFNYLAEAIRDLKEYQVA